MLGTQRLYSSRILQIDHVGDPFGLCVRLPNEHQAERAISDRHDPLARERDAGRNQECVWVKLDLPHKASEEADPSRAEHFQHGRGWCGLQDTRGILSYPD